MRVAFGLLAILPMTTLAAATELPKWAQGTWADNKLATCEELNSPKFFKDGGFVYINGSEIGGHEWGCRAVGKSSSGEYSFNCGGEGVEWSARAKFKKNGREMLIRWTDFDQGKPRQKTWHYPDWCRKGPPAFWVQ